MFHPVIQSLLNRRGQKVPINDGKKISLVLYGGVMAGVTGGAAVIALEELGLTNAFDNIFVVSAGLPNASYFLSKQTRLGTSIYYENLNKRKFINFFRFWNPANTEKVVEAIRDAKPLKAQEVLSSRTNIFVRLFNTKTKKAEYLNLKDVCKNVDDYFSLLKSAITFSTAYGLKDINGESYVDGAMWGGRGDEYIKDHFGYANSQEHTDLLVLYPSNKPKLEINSDNICEIILPVNFSKFETKESVLKQAALEAGLCVKQAFGVDEGITL